MSEDFGMSNGGSMRRIGIGRSWEEFDEEMSFYIQDPETRSFKYEKLLKQAINQGFLQNVILEFQPDEEFDLSDAVINQELNKEK